MKKNLLLLLFAFSTFYFSDAQTVGYWKKCSIIDEFGDATKDSYISILLEEDSGYETRNLQVNIMIGNNNDLVVSVCDPENIKLGTIKIKRTRDGKVYNLDAYEDKMRFKWYSGSDADVWIQALKGGHVISRNLVEHNRMWVYRINYDTQVTQALQQLLGYRVQRQSSNLISSNQNQHSSRYTNRQDSNTSSTKYVYADAYDGFVNIRSQPKAGSSILGRLENGGTGVKYLGTHGKWYKVSYYGSTGYVDSRYAFIR